MPELGTENRSTTSRSYHGRTTYFVDSARRVMIPKEWRPDDRKTQFMALLWPILPANQDEVHLVMLPPAQTEEVLQKVRGADLLTDDESAQMQRGLSVSSARLSLDKAWRFCLPAALADGAGIGKEALFVGRLHLFEIWSPQRYRPDMQEHHGVAARKAIQLRL